MFFIQFIHKAGYNFIHSYLFFTRRYIKPSINFTNISRWEQRLLIINKHMSVNEILIKETNLVIILDISKSNRLPLQELVKRKYIKGDRFRGIGF